MRNILILTVAAGVLTGCFQSKESELKPEEALKAFYGTLLAGDFALAESMCDTVSMKGYIDAVRSVWSTGDENVMKIAADILSETSVTVTDIEKNGQDRTIFYELTSESGRKRGKIATLRKEEGEWKIEQITDRD